MPRFNPLLDALPAYPAHALEQRKAAAVAAGRRIFDFGVGDPYEPAPDFVRSALVDALGPACPYPSVRGRPGLRTSIANYLARRFGVTVDPAAAILPTSGAKEAVFHLPAAFIDPRSPDRLVPFPDPGYPAYSRGVLFAGGEPAPIRLSGDHHLRPADLSDALLARSRMVWLNHPHNPSGATLSREELRALADRCRAFDVVLVNDETYADVYTGAPPASLLEAGLENVLVVHSLSKRSGMTGYRSGFLAGDPAVIARLSDHRTNPGLAPQDFVNAAAAAAWEDDAHVAQRRVGLARRKALLVDALREAGLDVLPADATLYLWVRTPPGWSDTAFAAHLLDAGIVVAPGSSFGVAGGGAGYIRVAVILPEDDLRASLPHWRAALQAR
jgi:succinyldiaminopimelate transaminase